MLPKHQGQEQNDLYSIDTPLPPGTDDNFQIELNSGVAVRLSYRFGTFVYDRSSGRLFAGGKIVPITQKQFLVLGVLLDAQGAVVMRSKFFAKVWSDTSVDDSNLTQVVFTLRKVLGKLPNGTDYIETVPKRGYRMSPAAMSTRLLVANDLVQEVSVPVPVPMKRSVRSLIFQAFRAILRSGGGAEPKRVLVSDTIDTQPDRDRRQNKLVA